jgi:hypothetical protein
VIGSYVLGEAMDYSWVEGLFRLLFGNLGPMGTLFVVVAGYLVWQLKLAQDDLRNTRNTLGELNEKRLQLHAENLKTLGELKQSIDALARRRR